LPEEDALPSDIRFGTLESPNASSGALSLVDVRLSVPDVVHHWDRCRLTADYLAGFLVPEVAERHDVRMELSMIIDELLENAVKFCASNQEPVAVTVRHFGDAIWLETSNLCDKGHAEQLEASIRRVMERDIEELFIEQIETSAKTPDASGLGFITLCLNHDAKIGARISEATTDLYRVTVEVLIDRQEVVTP